jgi:hypothetical protein
MSLLNNPSKSCLIFGAKQIVQVVCNHEKYVRGTNNMKNVAVLNEDLKKGHLVIVLIE